MKKIFFIFCIIHSFLQNSPAQIIPIDKTDTALYQKKWMCNGNLNIGVEGDKQKNFLLDATNTFDLQLQHYKELLIVSASYRFTYNDNQDFLNSGYVHLRWRHHYKNIWQPETFMQYQWDNAIGLLHRYLAGLNARCNFLRQKKLELSVATGLMFENETWSYTAVDPILQPALPNNKITTLLKSNNYFRCQKKISENTKLLIVVFYQTPFNNLIKQYRLATNIHFDVAITNHFDFATSLNTMYDNQPVVPIFKFYYNFSNAIVYKF